MNDLMHMNVSPPSPNEVRKIEPIETAPYLDDGTRIYSVWPVGREKFSNAVKVRATGPKVAISAYAEHLGDQGLHIRPPKLICVNEETQERRFFNVTYKVHLTCQAEEYVDA